MVKRILVTGSRTWIDRDTIRHALRERGEPGAVLVHGGCPHGADAIADAIWRSGGCEVNIQVGYVE